MFEAGRAAATTAWLRASWSRRASAVAITTTDLKVVATLHTKKEHFSCDPLLDSSSLGGRAPWGLVRLRRPLGPCS